jgi:hypothetical protein
VTVLPSSTSTAKAFQAKSLKTGSVTQMAEARPAERMIASLKNQSFASSPLEAK